jgi:hypothetical protein
LSGYANDLMLKIFLLYLCCRLIAVAIGEGETIDVIFDPEWFFDREGRTYESVGLRPDRLMVLCFDFHPVREASALAERLRQRVSPTMVTV